MQAEVKNNDLNAKQEQETKIMYDANRLNMPGLNLSYKHDFSKKKYISTYKSVFKCIFNSLIAIFTFGFHASIAAILCLVLKIAPLSSSAQRRLQRNIKSYGGHIVNTVLGLWFNQTFFISIDNKLYGEAQNSKNGISLMKLLTISNHVSDVDWMFLSRFAEILNIFRYTYIIMKHEISTWPIAGFFTKNFGHYFVGNKSFTGLQRKANDLLIMSNFSKSILEDFQNQKNNSRFIFSWIAERITSFLVKFRIISKNCGANGLFFPEATTFTKKSYERTLEFYQKTMNASEEFTDLFKPEYVLLPKPLGTAVVLAQLSSILDGICDITLFSFPFVSSNCDCHSFVDIFLCRAPAFSFCAMLDFLEIPQDLKESIGSLPKESLHFQDLFDLSNQEKHVKAKTLSFLNKVFKRKNDLIKNYVEGEYKGNFKNIEEFKKFVNLNSSTTSTAGRHYLPVKIYSPHKIYMFATSIMFYSIILYAFFAKK